MTASVPWSVNAVDPEAWADARDAARRAGLSVGEWLETTIRDAASERGRPPRHAARAVSSDVIERRLDDFYEKLDQFARRLHEQPSVPRQERSDPALQHSVEALNARIDNLVRDLRRGDRNGPAEIRTAIQRLEDRIDDLMARGRLASATVAPELEHKLEHISRTIENMSRRIEQENRRYAATAVPSTVDELDSAVAEIMMRQSALDGVPPREFRPRAPEQRGPDLSRLESQLKLMTEEMQALRRAGMQTEAIDALRRDVRELAGKFGELAPRHSLESLEEAIESIAQRVDRTTGSRPDEMLADVVGALNDIRAALSDVRPAESFKSVERELHELSSKLDNLHVGGIDERAVIRLQQQTAEIRDLLSSALPSDVLKALVDQIELLVNKFEDRGSGSDHALLDVIAAFDRRIDALSERIEAASREGPAAPALEDIRSRLDELQYAVARIDQRKDPGVEAALQAMADKLDLTEARLGNLGMIERGLKDLHAQLQEVRASVREASERPAYPAARGVAETDEQQRSFSERDTKSASPAEASEASRLPEPRIVSVRAEPRTQASLSSIPPVSDTLAAVPADFPLEPGSGAPRVRLQSAALRVAQSEAALGEAAPKLSSPASTSDFIAAARRAAQAAAAEPKAEAPKAGVEPARARAVRFVGNSRRALLIGLTAFLLIFAALRFFDGQLLNPFRSQPAVPAATKAPQPEEPATPAPVRPEPAPPAQEDQSRLLPGTGGDTLASAPPAGVIGSNETLPFMDQPADPIPTGSTSGAKPNAPIQTASAPAGADAAPSNNDLPDSLGTPALRSAALAGDAAAAYEIGARYLEGRGVRADVAEAMTWFERAVAKGSMPAAYRLGSLHEKGSGTAKNSAEAMRYYTIAAEGGNTKAMHNLAVMLAEGATGQPDYRAAARWFRMAAERGVRDSQYNLGVLYARGLGVEQNLAESFRWFAIAANQGDADAGKKRDDVAKRLDVQTLVAAKLAVQTWQPAAIQAAANEVRLKPEWEKAEAAPRKRSVKK